MKNLAFLSLLLVSGCSLLKVELDPGTTPLDPWQLNARNGVHAYAGAINQMAGNVADSILNDSEDQQDQVNALLWKIGFTSAIRKAAFVTDPELSLMDSWTFIKQHRDFFYDGAGADLFPGYQEMTRFYSDSMLIAFEETVEGMYKPEEYQKRRNFVEDYSSREKLKDLGFERNFILFEWKNFLNIPDSTNITTVGNLPQVMTDFSEKFGFYTETGPDQLKWQLDLLKLDIAADSSIQAEMDSLKGMANRLVVVAENSPEMIDSVMMQMDVIIRRLEGNLNNAIAVVDRNWVVTLDKLKDERAVLVEEFRSEREVVMDDLNYMSLQVADKALGHIKGIVRTALIFGIVLVVLLFGLPFVAGYYIGKLVQKKKAES